MNMYCVNAQKTTIDYFNKEGENRKFITSQGDLSVDCVDYPRTGRYIFTIKDKGYNIDCSPQYNYYYYSNIFVADSYSVSSGTSPFPNVAQCSWTKLTFYIGETVAASQNFPSAYQVEQANNPDYFPGGKALIIRDSQNNELTKISARDCNFTVACDDDCPEGSRKCTHNKYPGYCCIPCKETGDRLKNLANKIGR